ncbi:MAG: DUF3616 domain-containing protein [Parafilimonas terrae]|nr:DUF3616 domain-containing protein [Parafilimonas terrae]
MRHLITLTTAIALGATSPASAETTKPALAPVKSWAVPRHLAGEEKDDKVLPADDVSGIACRPAAGGARTCLIVNDQNRFAQAVTLDAGKLVAGPTVDLIGEEPDKATLGTELNPKEKPLCEKKDSFKDLDGEGVAYAAPYFYVVGSHGCSRKKDKFRLSSYILARIRVEDGKAIKDGTVETTYRLSDVLSSTEAVKDYFSTSLSKNGLNVEGVAVIGDTLYAGLRGPSLGGMAYIVPAKIADLFAPKHEKSPSQAAPIALPLGEGVGIRDLAALDDGRLLVLSGPVADVDGAYDIYAVTPAPGAKPVHLATLARVEGQDSHGKAAVGKAEGLLVLTSKPLRVLVVFDGLVDGKPSEYDLSD